MMSETTPTRRRQGSALSEPSNAELLTDIANDDSPADSKKRRNVHLELGPLVISGAAIDRVRARFISL